MSCPPFIHFHYSVLGIHNRWQAHWSGGREPLRFCGMPSKPKIGAHLQIPSLLPGWRPGAWQPRSHLSYAQVWGRKTMKPRTRLTSERGSQQLPLLGPHLPMFPAVSLDSHLMGFRLWATMMAEPKSFILWKTNTENHLSQPLPLPSTARLQPPTPETPQTPFKLQGNVY